MGYCVRQKQEKWLLVTWSIALNQLNGFGSDSILKYAHQSMETVIDFSKKWYLDFLHRCPT